MHAEREALAAAGRLVSPHRVLAAYFGSRAWVDPMGNADAAPAHRAAGKPSLFFPASKLGRNGAFELAAALKSGIDAELRFLGPASEGPADPFAEIPCSRAGLADLASAAALVLPAWVEHQTRLALLALASGIPVIATEACGLPPHPCLHEIAEPTPISPPAGPAQWLLQGPPAESKFLAPAKKSKNGLSIACKAYPLVFRSYPATNLPDHHETIAANCPRLSILSRVDRLRACGPIEHHRSQSSHPS